MGRVYIFPSKNKAVQVIIFSSVDIKSEKVREVGNDAVRLVYNRTTRNGVMYKKIGKHYRVESLFNNLEGTLDKALNDVFKLELDGWKRDI